MSNATANRAPRFVGRSFRAVDPCNETSLAVRAMPTARKGRATRLAEVIAWSCVCLLLFMGSSLSADEIRFNEHVRPILAEHCLHCHGPDENHREGELRLDVTPVELLAADRLAAEQPVKSPPERQATQSVGRPLQ